MRLPVRLTPQHPLRKLTAAIIIAAVATAIAMTLHHVPGTADAMSGLDETLYDAFYRMRKAEDRKDGPIVIVTGDDNTMEQLAKHHIKWPYPRGLWGEAAQYVESLGAKAVVFDLTFEGATSDDEDFAGQLDSIKIPVVIGTDIKADGTTEIFAPKLKKPPLFGAVNILEDKVIRTYLPVVNGTPSLSLRTIQTIGDQQPGWAKDPFRLHYYGPTQWHAGPDLKFTYKYISAWAVFTAAQAPGKAASLGIAPDVFRGKIVLFGYTSAGMYDLKSSPLSAMYPGVEVHATAIDNMIADQRVKPIGPVVLTVGTLIFMVLAGLAIILPRRVTIKAIGAAAVVSATLLTAVALFRQSQIRWSPMASPIAGLIITVVAAFAWSYLTEDRQRRLILKALTQYLSPEIAAEIERNPSALKLGGERREMTVLFSDIQGFTDLSESMASEKLSAVLNFYLGEMSSVMLDNNGTLDKYIGDAIMTFWSAPIVQPDHAIRACRSALAMRDRESKIQPELAALGAEGMLTRIGINTGPMVFGNMGSPHKFSYSVLGDSVNLGSRLEGANKFYGSRILISESTAMLAKGKFILRKLDVLRVKGKQEPLAVYELIGEGEADPDTRTRIAGYGEAFANYQGQNWDDAQRILEKLHAQFPDDQPVAALMKRIEKLRHDPPLADWDGVYVAKEK